MDDEPSMMLWPWKTPPSSTTRVLDVMLPSILPPRARCALPLTWIEPLNRPAMLTFPKWARRLIVQDSTKGAV